MTVQRKHNPLSIWPLAKILLAVGVILWLLMTGKVDFQRFRAFQSPLPWLGGVTLFTITLFCNAFRWSLLLKTRSIALNFPRALSLSVIGLFFNFVIPGGVGGDVVKASYLFSDFPSQKWEISWITIFDRVLGILSLLGITVVVGFWQYDEFASLSLKTFYQTLFGLTGGIAVAGLTLIFAPWTFLEKVLVLLGPLKEKFRPIVALIKEPQLWLFPLIVGFIGQVAMISVFAFLGWSTGQAFAMDDYWVCGPAGLLSAALPLTPAGLGVGQYAFSFLFQERAGDGPFGVMAISFLQTVQFLVGLSGGVLFLLSGGRKKGSMGNFQKPRPHSVGKEL